MRRLGRLIWRVANKRFIKWPLAASIAFGLVLCAPVAYVEVACRADLDNRAIAYQSVIAEPSFQRREANTYLTYPEWHIVYAYDGLAEALKAGDEYAFAYLASIEGFWRATCSLMRVADRHGGADWATRSMIHTIGVSFTAEMLLKALYEETIGRTFAWIRGPEKTPQDKAVATMALDYSAFLRQTPWYAYPFPRELRSLWAAPAGGSLRAWERRIGIGAEFLAKSAYAKVIAGAVAATEPAKLDIRSVVTAIDHDTLARVPGVTIAAERAGGIEIQTPRYDLFTRILVSIAGQGGSIVEIAGNDDIMLTVNVPPGFDAPLVHGTEILRIKRAGFPGDRLLVNVKVKELAAFLNAHPLGDPGLEHVFDY